MHSLETLQKVYSFGKLSHVCVPRWGQALATHRCDSFCPSSDSIYMGPLKDIPACPHVFGRACMDGEASMATRRTSVWVRGVAGWTKAAKEGSTFSISSPRLFAYTAFLTGGAGSIEAGCSPVDTMSMVSLPARYTGV